MIFQSDFTIFRFANLKPDSLNSEKYQYQLFRKGEVISDRFSNDEYLKGKVTVSSKGLDMYLFTNPSDIDTKEIEDENTFIIDIQIIN